VSLERLEMQRVRLSGGVPEPTNPATRCAFHPGCHAFIDTRGEMVPELVRWAVGTSCPATSRPRVGLAGGQGRNAFLRQSLGKLGGVVL
jgi:hypothetical protein